jgi:hypothetical protein
MAPFLSYYGSKFRSAKRYPYPDYDCIIEPFAGAAGYSLNYFQRKIILIEKDPRIALIWRYLISSKPSDILELPLMELDQTISDLPECDSGGKELIRAWLQGGSRNGKNSYSSMAKNNLLKNPNTPAFWGRACRQRIADNVEAIGHWEIIEGEYLLSPNISATWFIDPPYNNAAGRVYNYHSINYEELGIWSKLRLGQIIVCENLGADWLPFRPLYETKNNWNSEIGKKSIEVIWP